MNKFTVPLLCAAAALPLAFGPSVQGQPSGKREAHLVAFQDPDPDSGAIDESSADYDIFYERLSSDGNWFYDDDYGYVWQPNVAVSTSSWRPYTDGHWVWTDRGWCWISNEDFGWATYHYGRWVRVSGSGWIWVPGDQWAPAWVSWRHTDDDDYVGWAPLPPEASVTASVGVHSWCDSYYDIGPAAFSFIRIRDFCRPSYGEFIVPPQQNFTIINRTQNITNITYNNNLVYNYGPQYERVSQIVRRQGQQVPNYQINYTPQVQRTAPFRTESKGNQLNVIAPPSKLKPIASTQPQVTKQLGKAPVDRGWRDVPENQAQQLRQKFAQQAAVPKTLPPKPLPPPKPQIQAAKGNQQGQPGKPGTNGQLPNEKAKTVTGQQKVEGQKPQIEQKKEQTQQPVKPGEPANKAAEAQKGASEKGKTLQAEKGQPAGRPAAHPETQKQKGEQPKNEQGTPGQTQVKHPHPNGTTKGETTHHVESPPKPHVQQAYHPAQQHVTHASHPPPPPHPPAQQHVAQAPHPPPPHPPPQQHLAQAPHQQQPNPQPKKAESKDKKKDHQG
jgi:hypothetical protein